jgi:hypothetical protein
MAATGTRISTRNDHLGAHVQSHRYKYWALTTLKGRVGTIEPRFAGSQSFGSQSFDHKVVNQTHNRKLDRYRLRKHLCLMAGTSFLG